MERWSDGSPAPTVGKEIRIDSLRGQPTVKVVMAIKAPRGMCRIFGQPPNRYSKHLGQAYVDAQCEAIRAFMEQHSTLIGYQEDDGEID